VAAALALAQRPNLFVMASAYLSIALTAEAY
jgi:hypothetical protein